MKRMTKEEAIERLGYFLRTRNEMSAWEAEQEEPDTETIHDIERDAEALRFGIRALGGKPEE